MARRVVRFAGVLALVAPLACGHNAAPVAAPPPQEAVHIEGTNLPANGSGTPSAAAMSEAGLPLPIRYDDPVRGNRNAYVTLVVFSDFQCPFCARHARNVEELRAKYGPDALRIVFKHQPLEFHDKAAYAAEVAAGVLELGGHDAFWAFHDLAFARAQTLGKTELVAWAVEVGIDERALVKGLDERRWESKVAADIELAKTLDVQGTPCSFANGVRIGGAMPLSHLVDVVDAELAKAKSLAERGVAREAVYGRMLVANLTAAPSRAPAEVVEKQEDTAIYKVSVGSAPTRGPATALVTIVEFSDFQCPFCARVQPTLERIRKEYGDKVRFVWKDEPLPFHPRALPAANFARSARAQKGNTGFWAAHDALFANQTHMADSDLEQLGKKLGINTAAAMTAVRNGTFNKSIDADKTQGASVRANGTPHFFINGRRLVGAQPFEKFKTVIDQEMARAEGLVKSGVARTALYNELTKAGVVAPVAPVAPPAPAAPIAAGGPAVARGHVGPSPTTLLVTDLKVGTGAAAKDGDNVRVQYVGTLADGTEFDSTRTAGRSPFEFDLGKGMVIKGWDQGVVGMRVGGRRKLTIPPSLGYGARSAGKIPPDSVLVFDVELLEIK